MSRKRSWLGVLPAALLLPPALSIAGLAEELKPKELRLGYFPNITHAQVLYGRATGQFGKELDVPIKWVAFNAGPTAIESLFADAVDATFVGPSPTINGYIQSKGAKFVVVAGSASGGAGLVVRKDSGIANDADFAGKTIATPQLGNTQDVAARVWLANKGYRLRERGGNVSLVPLSNPDQLTMFKKNQIDGAWTVEPWLARLEVEGGGQVFLEEKSLWPGGKYVTTHLVMNRAFLARYPETVGKLISVLVEITEQINSNKSGAAAVLNDHLRKETGKTLRPEVILKAMARVDFTWDPLGASLKTSALMAHRIGFLRKEPDLAGIYSLDLLNQVLKERHLAPVEAPAL